MIARGDQACAPVGKAGDQGEGAAGGRGVKFQHRLIAGQPDSAAAFAPAFRQLADHTGTVGAAGAVLSERAVGEEDAGGKAKGKGEKLTVHQGTLVGAE